MKLLSHVQLFVTPWNVAYQAPLSMGFSRQEYWSGLPFPSPGDLLDPGFEPGLPHWRQTLYRLSHQGSPKMNIMGIYISKLESCPGPAGFPCIFLFSLLETQRLVHFPIFYASTTQFTFFVTNFPHLFFSCSTGVQTHFTLVCFCSSMMRQGKRNITCGELAKITGM